MKYSLEIIVEKNITLAFEFARYVEEHPETLEHIPAEAEVVLLPKDDPQLYRHNLVAARQARRKTHAPAVFIEVDGLAPAHSRLVNPRIKAHPSIRALPTAR